MNRMRATEDVVSNKNLIESAYMPELTSRISPRNIFEDAGSSFLVRLIMAILSNPFFIRLK